MNCLINPPELHISINGLTLLSENCHLPRMLCFCQDCCYVLSVGLPPSLSLPPRLCEHGDSKQLCVSPLVAAVDRIFILGL